MPDGKMAVPIKQQQSNRRQTGAKVGEKHDHSPVIAIHHDSSEWAYQDKGDEAKETKQSNGSRLARLLVGPNQQSKAGHPCSQEGNQLTRPNDEKCTQPRQDRTN